MTSRIPCYAARVLGSLPCGRVFVTSPAPVEMTGPKTSAKQLKIECISSAMRVRSECKARANRVHFKCNASAKRVQSTCKSSAFQVQCECETSAARSGGLRSRLTNALLGDVCRSEVARKVGNRINYCGVQLPSFRRLVS